jgi:hypothetical protein
MDSIAFGVLPLLLGVMLVVGWILFLTVYLFKSRPSGESGGGMRASDIVFGMVVLAIWVLSWAGLLGWFSGPSTPAMADVHQSMIAIGLPWLVVTSYTVVLLAFVVRRRLRAIRAAYRERQAR